MIESISTAAAMTIAKIAFDKFIEGGAGELGRKVTEEWKINKVTNGRIVYV